MPLVALAFTYGSVGDVLETARLAKRIIDVLRSASGGSPQRHRMISTLKDICDDVSTLTTLAVDVDLSSPGVRYFVNRLSVELGLCRALMDRCYAKINAPGIIGRVWMVLSEEKELTSWRAQISERRRALHLLLGALNSLHSRELGEELRRVASRVDTVGAQVENIVAEVRNVGTLTEFAYLHSREFGEELGRVATRVDTVGAQIENVVAEVCNVSTLTNLHSREFGEELGRVASRVDTDGAQVENVGAEVRNVGNLPEIISTFLSAQVSHMRSEIRQVGTDVEQILHRVSPYDLQDSVFFVMDPLGRVITIQLAHCNGFWDLDRIIQAHLYNCPEAGSIYVKRGDYKIVSSEGFSIDFFNFPEKLGAGMQFEMCIVKRMLLPSEHRCPHCNNRTSPDAIKGKWTNW
ncbi:hypothetical protein C8R44DRAFT_730701 [Mycena epipterygia]|nr:hypothetical protein C8R44DRAFT_730701 [Mycena epipterygia]